MVERDGTATVRAVHGGAVYSIGGGAPQALRPNMILPEGATIQTEPDARVDLQVNGRTSKVRIEANTKMTLSTMEAFGEGVETNTETMLDLKIGTLLGSVKEISKNSRYEISTPRGVAGIRGAEFAVQVAQNGDGTYNVTFSSVFGTVYVVANVIIWGVPTPIPKVLTTGYSWTPPEIVNAVGDIPPVQYWTPPEICDGSW